MNRRPAPPHSSRALADLLERQIRAGQYAPGEKLPSAYDLARVHFMHHTTAQRATMRLAERGMAQGIAGVGTFVLGAEHWRRIPE